MKGIIIYENDLRRIDAVKLKEASFCYESVEDSITDTLQGTPVICESVNCNKEDTYDFETGALIVLMKMCKFDKSYKAIEEAFNYNSYDTKKTKELEEENKNLKKRINELEIYNNQLEDRVAAEQRGGYKFLKDMEKLQHEYDLCKNSENALKCSVDYLNKTIAKLNAAIYGHKEDLYKVTKRCEELEIKESTLNKQEETINKREEKMSAYFGGRGCGKQCKALVELFKKLPQDKVQAAYVTAYKESLIWCSSQPSIRDSLTVDSLIEQSRAFTRKCVDEWLCKPHKKREEMWGKIVTNDEVVVKVKKEDINIFLKELETRNDVIRWITNLKPTEALTNPVLNRNAHSKEHCYFYLESNCRLWYDTYLQDNHKDFIQIDYLPPMRWDLFKKGRIVVGVRNNNELVEFRKEVERNTGIKNIPMCPTNLCLFYSFDKDDYKIILETIEEPNIAKINNHKVVYWEDVR